MRIIIFQVKNLFICDRCEREFKEMHHLDEHHKKLCIKKELDSDQCGKLESGILASIDNYYNSDGNYQSISSYYNENSEKYTFGNDNLPNVFNCNRCKKEFLEKYHLEEHYQKVCIKKKKELDFEEFASLTSVPSFFHAPENVNIILHLKIFKNVTL